MKLLLLPLFLLAGLAGARFVPAASAAPAPPAPCLAEDCTVRVERTGPDTCRVTCIGADGAILCQREVVCGESCERPCETSGAKACPKAGACSR